MRFTQGLVPSARFSQQATTDFKRRQVLSDEGKKLAGEDPYLVRNGPFKELVISSPDHLQDFLRKDAKGLSIV